MQERGEKRGRQREGEKGKKGKGKREGSDKLGKGGERKGHEAPQLKFLATPLSKRRANVFKIHVLIARRLLDICSMFALSIV